MEGQSQKRGVKSPKAGEGEFGRNSERSTTCVIHRTSGEEQTVNNQKGLMEWLVNRENMMEAYRRVTTNKGAPGVDGITTEALRSCFATPNNPKGMKFTKTAVVRIRTPGGVGGRGAGRLLSYPIPVQMRANKRACELARETCSSGSKV